MRPYNLYEANRPLLELSKQGPMPDAMMLSQHNIWMANMNTVQESGNFKHYIRISKYFFYLCLIFPFLKILSWLLMRWLRSSICSCNTNRCKRPKSNFRRTWIYMFCWNFYQQTEKGWNTVIIHKNENHIPRGLGWDFGHQKITKNKPLFLFK